LPALVEKATDLKCRKTASQPAASAYPRGPLAMLLLLLLLLPCIRTALKIRALGSASNQPSTPSSEVTLSIDYFDWKDENNELDR
jgi:hypothetical protein